MRVTMTASSIIGTPLTVMDCVMHATVHVASMPAVPLQGSLLHAPRQQAVMRATSNMTPTTPRSAGRRTRAVVEEP